MTRALLACALMIFTLSPAIAQDSPDVDPDPGLSLMERGARLFMQGILREMEPAIEDLSELGGQMAPALRSFANEMGPALKKLMDQVEDWSAYAPPELLPNGDIIMRRKSGEPPTAPPVIMLEKHPEIEI